MKQDSTYQDSAPAANQERPDDEIVREVLAGNTQAYALLLRRHNQQLFRIGMAYLRRESDVEDAMQSAWIKAFHNLSGFSGQARFSTWLTRILINECLQCLRRRVRDQQVIENASRVAPPDLAAPAADNALMQREMNFLLENAVLQLPTAYRTVYLLRETQQLSTLETAECLGISPENVKVRLLRAKQKLKDELLRQTEGREIFHFHLTRCDGLERRVMTEIAHYNLKKSH